MEYEINFLVLQSNTEQLDKIREKVKKVILAHQGSITENLEYKKRKLAYEIKHEFYGFYSIFRFKVEDPSVIELMKKDLNLILEVARYIIVRTAELPPLQKTVEPAKLEVPEREKTTIKQEEVEKILAGEKDGTAEQENKAQKQQTAEKQEPASEEKDVPETKVETKKEAKKDEKKQDDSLEDLDKKLDEILNI